MGLGRRCIVVEDALSVGFLVMPRDELAARARAWAERTCAAQGLPVKVEDPAALAKVVAVVRDAGQTRQTGSTRSSSKLVRPGLARRIKTRSRSAAMTACWRESDSSGQASRSLEEAPT